jgi:hypothetical protein
MRNDSQSMHSGETANPMPASAFADASCRNSGDLIFALILNKIVPPKRIPAPAARAHLAARRTPRSRLSEAPMEKGFGGNIAPERDPSRCASRQEDAL